MVGVKCHRREHFAPESRAKGSSSSVKKGQREELGPERGPALSHGRAGSHGQWLMPDCITVMMLFQFVLLLLFLIKAKSVCQHKLKAKFKRKFIFTEGPYKHYHKNWIHKTKWKNGSSLNILFFFSFLWPNIIINPVAQFFNVNMIPAAKSRSIRPSVSKKMKTFFPLGIL